ncbi:MAG TPA: glycosyltransferase [Thermoanaerobaculia bacterium]|nr:glycosyltransferase [Thermoanaerobaculia bacterium]
MNVLLISSRFPWPAYSGDRLRTTIWLSALQQANVALVAPPGDAPPQVRFYPAGRSLASGARAVVRTLRDSLPWQSLLAAPYAWDDAVASARRDFGSFDATVVILSRLHPWIPAAEGTRILDAIDSLARNMHERARAASPLTRWIWRAEERRTARAEAEIERAYDRILYVSGDETGERGLAISNGVRIRPLEPRERRFDFGFWGRLAYFANADAAQWLVDEIWPAIRALRPAATLVIAGADAPRALARAAQRAGITFLSPVDDVPVLARDVRVAILPLRYGSGESTKMLEAAEAGCTVVATARGVRSLPELAQRAAIAEDAPAIARAAVDALAKPDTELRRLVVQHYSREATLEKLSALVRRKAA